MCSYSKASNFAVGMKDDCALEDDKSQKKSVWGFIIETL